MLQCRQLIPYDHKKTNKAVKVRFKVYKNKKQLKGSMQLPVKRHNHVLVDNDGL